ncbi:hypothetical protein [Enterococcus faecium]|uniref:hypothetical protein n=1 Tax=Enterococcus faecium TaxID=1352 RepID=UPI0021FD5C97|nr:hypothetical protein [Enterococcus faecium]BDP45541.1 hypothetical protein EfmJHP9_04110 [Enterococcus faecium]
MKNKKVFDFIYILKDEWQNVTAWLAEIDKLTNYLTDFDQPLSLNLGGGFGIRYTQTK